MYKSGSHLQFLYSIVVVEFYIGTSYFIRVTLHDEVRRNGMSGIERCKKRKYELRSTRGLNSTGKTLPCKQRITCVTD